MKCLFYVNFSLFLFFRWWKKLCFCLKRKNMIVFRIDTRKHKSLLLWYEGETRFKVCRMSNNIRRFWNMFDIWSFFRCFGWLKFISENLTMILDYKGWAIYLSMSRVVLYCVCGCRGGSYNINIFPFWIFIFRLFDNFTADQTLPMPNLANDDEWGV